MMTRNADLTMDTPARGDAKAGRSLRRTLARRLPLAAPWSPLQTMTGLVVEAQGVALARGRLDGRLFRVQETLHLPGPDLAGSLREMGRVCDGPVCVQLPAGRTMVRRFEAPAQSDAELEAMLPHLLASELPQALDNFAWTWRALPAETAGFTLAEVHVARCDQLEEFIKPLTAAGLNVVDLVPEEWSREQARSWVGGAGVEVDEPVSNSFVNQDEGAPCLAASVEAYGLARRRSLLPPSQARRCRRRLAWDAAVRTGGVLLVAALVWLAAGVQGAVSDRARLEDLRSVIAERAAAVAELDRQHAAIRESERLGHGGAEILQVLDTLRRRVERPTHLDHLDYVAGRGVTLRGQAATSSAVLEMGERLSEAPAWRGLRVTELRSERVDGTEMVHFVIEARME